MKGALDTKTFMMVLFVFVGTRVAGMHTQLGEEEAQEHTTQK